MTPDPRRSDSSRVSHSEARAPVRFYRQIASHRWAKPLVRALSIAFALIVLVAIGSSARAVPQTVTPVSTASAEVASAATSTTPLPSAAAHPTMTAAAPGAAPPIAAEHAKRATVDDPVSINSATLDDLERLPGIGPKRAGAILDLRTKLGHFRQIEDLLRVKGIGRATLKKLRPIVRLD